MVLVLVQVAANGRLLQQGTQFSVRDVEVLTCTVRLFPGSITAEVAIDATVDKVVLASSHCGWAAGWMLLAG